MIYILLPAYNEERDIGPLFSRIEQVIVSTGYAIKVLVVNDGSKDNTLGVVQSFLGRVPYEILDHGVNKGLGQAMLTGLTRASELAGSDDLVVAMDADNTHDPALIGALRQKFQDGQPPHEGRDMIPIRRLLFHV